MKTRAFGLLALILLTSFASAEYDEYGCYLSPVAYGSPPESTFSDVLLDQDYFIDPCTGAIYKLDSVSSNPVIYNDDGTPITLCRVE